MLKKKGHKKVLFFIDARLGLKDGFKKMIKVFEKKNLKRISANA